MLYSKTNWKENNINSHNSDDLVVILVFSMVYNFAISRVQKIKFLQANPLAVF